MERGTSHHVREGEMSEKDHSELILKWVLSQV
jgi:hypothetical protein